MDGPSLEIMNPFDFSKPVNVTIIYENSEESDESLIKVKQEEETKDNILDQQQEHFETNYSMPNIDNFSNETGRNKRVCSESTENNNIEVRTIKKRKLDSPKEKKKQEEVKDNKIIETNSPVKENHNAHSFYFTDKKENDVNKENKTQNKVTEDCVKQNVSIASKTNCRLENQSENNGENDTSENTQTNTANFNEITDYIKDTLSTLSQNIILCVKEFRKHLQRIENINGGETNPVVQDSRKRFLRWKFHYYQLSYCAVANIILKQENKSNTKFTEDFLNRTLLYAKENMNLIFSKQDLEPFYYEIIAWAKRVQENLNKMYSKTTEQFVTQNKSETLRPNVIPNTQVKNGTPLLTMALAQPPNSLLQKIVSQQPPHKHQPNMIPIFTGGAPDREIVVSVDNTALNGFRNQSFPSQENRYPNSQQKAYHTASLPVVPDTEVNQYVENITSYNNNSIPAETVLTTNTRNDYQYNYPNGVNSLVHDQHYCRTIQRPAAPPPYHSSHYNLYAQHPQHCANNDRYRSQAAQPIPQQSTVQQHKNTTYVYRQNEQNQTIDQSRSSVSTDSGFASPLQFNTSTNGVTPSDERQHVVPLITHVTSLNPSVQHITEGVCHVCTARTKSKCLGCLQTYYCSSICQTIDWYVHAKSCQHKQNAASVKPF